ncbi:MAG: septal ring lytic transglycosylase RlpA family protein [Pseudomonadota bacterium]
MACASTPPAKPHYKVGGPYRVNGRLYVPQEDRNYDRIGMASWYGKDFHGKRTANGEIFDRRRVSAAHTTLPLPSIVRVDNLDNGRSIRVRVNDRGPFVGNRIIDLSEAAARKLGFRAQGLARVRVRYIKRARLSGSAPALSYLVAVGPVQPNDGARYIETMLRDKNVAQAFDSDRNAHLFIGPFTDYASVEIIRDQAASVGFSSTVLAEAERRFARVK